MWLVCIRGNKEKVDVVGRHQGEARGAKKNGCGLYRDSQGKWGMTHLFPVCVDDGVTTEAAMGRSHFASDASRAWNTLLRSVGGVVTGEGLISGGLSLEAAKQEVSKIDQENTNWLNQFSEQEILEQQEKIRNTLGIAVDLMYAHCNISSII